MTMYLQHDDIINKEIDKDIIKQEIYNYKNSVDLREFINRASWVMRSTSGSIFVDNNNNILTGTHRGWLTQNGKHMYKYVTKKEKPKASITQSANALPDTSKLGSPEIIQFLDSINALSYFKDAVTVEEYKEHIQESTESIPMIVKQKVAGLADNAKVYLNNKSVLEMNDDELEYIDSLLDIDLYVEMIAGYAELWHNPIVA